MAPKSLYQLQIEKITSEGILSKENLDDVLFEIGQNISKCLNVERVNVWLFNEAKQSILCIGNYTATGHLFSKGNVLFEKDMPNYYKSLKSNNILSIDDVYSDPRSKELAFAYCRPGNIYSMMDVPIHTAGKLVGIICFEHTGQTRNWTDEERFFALAISQIVSLAIETRKRRSTQLKLEKALAEKEILLAEMHHRIKNNLNILNSMLRMQANETDNEEYKLLAKDFENRILSIAKIHEQLYANNNYEKISLKAYLEVFLQEIKTSNTAIQFDVNLDEYWVDNEHIVPLGLICNEILTNTLKHAFNERIKSPTVFIELKAFPDGNHLLVIGDNGLGFDTEKALKNASAFGLSLIFDLVEQINGKIRVNSSFEDTKFQIIL